MIYPASVVPTATTTYHFEMLDIIISIKCFFLRGNASRHFLKESVAYAVKNYAGRFNLMTGIEVGTGRTPPRSQDNIRKFVKGFLKKIAKPALFGLFLI